jgi:hypothetical protein
VIDPNRACALNRASSGGQALIDQLARFTLDVKGQLVVQVTLGSSRREQRADAEFQVLQVHHSASFMPMPVS